MITYHVDHVIHQLIPPVVSNTEVPVQSDTDSLSETAHHQN